jgi:hypothetical protein
MNGTPIAAPLVIYTVVTGLIAAARNAKAKSSGSTEVFGCTLGTGLLIIVATIGFAIGAIYMLVAPPSYPLGAIICGLIALCGVAGYPTPITLSQEKIEQLKWWGGRVGFGWRDVTRIEFHKGPATTLVVGPDNKKIAHAGFHVASEEFRSECVARTHLKIITKEL